MRKITTDYTISGGGVGEGVGFYYCFSVVIFMGCFHRRSFTRVRFTVPITATDGFRFEGGDDAFTLREGYVIEGGYLGDVL